MNDYGTRISQEISLPFDGNTNSYSLNRNAQILAQDIIISYLLRILFREIILYCVYDSSVVVNNDVRVNNAANIVIYGVTLTFDRSSSHEFRS